MQRNTKRNAKPKAPRIVHVECATPADFRALVSLYCAGGVTARNSDGSFNVTDEAQWAELLRCCGGKEIA